MKRNQQQSGNFRKSGPTSTAWLHKKLVAIQRGNEGDIARDYRMAQENSLTARQDEEKQISELTTNRRASLFWGSFSSTGCPRSVGKSIRHQGKDMQCETVLGLRKEHTFDKVRQYIQRDPGKI